MRSPIGQKAVKRNRLGSGALTLSHDVYSFLPEIRLCHMVDGNITFKHNSTFDDKERLPL